MNQHFHRPLPIQRAVCVNKHENGTEPQSFPDPSCSLCTAEGAVLGATTVERAAALGAELVPGWSPYTPCFGYVRARGWGDGLGLSPVHPTAHPGVLFRQGGSCWLAGTQGLSEMEVRKGEARTRAVAPLHSCRWQTAPVHLSSMRWACPRCDPALWRPCWVHVPMSPGLQKPPPAPADVKQGDSSCTCLVFVKCYTRRRQRQRAVPRTPLCWSCVVCSRTRWLRGSQEPQCHFHACPNVGLGSAAPEGWHVSDEDWPSQ